MCFSLSIQAQNVTIINNYNGGDANTNPEDYVLSSVREQTTIINEFEPTSASPQSQLRQMIHYSLRAHIDKNFSSSGGRIKSRQGGREFNETAGAIVRNALWINDQEFSDEFKGFSPATLTIANDLREMDGYRVEGGTTDSREALNGRVGLYTFQRRVYDLKMSCDRDIDDFLAGYDIPQEDVEELSSGAVARLEPEEYKLDTNDIEDELSSLKPDLEAILPRDSKRKRKRRSDSDVFSERIVELLEENNKILANYNTRFEDLQNQINEIRSSGGSNDDIRDEIAELRAMIIDLAEGREIRERDGSRTRLVPNAGATITFAKNQHQLNFAQMTALNSVVTDLTRNSSYTAVITGYADKTGDRQFNSWISKQRANAVMRYLISQGISPSQMVVNHLGDTESLAPNPEDRKVEIQYISNYRG
jgi:outer membrane protein OmpA-like peptidoglycan-associated protein